MERFKPDINVGLTKKQVDSRFRDNLYNVDTTVSTKPTKDIIKDNVFTIFNIVNFFLACMVLTTGSYKNLLFMGGIICNTIISIFQELRSKKVLDKLQVINESKVCTIRDGKEEKLSISILGFILFGLSVSIDSFTTGIGINIINNNYLEVSTIFALTSSIFTYIGLKLGNRINKKLGPISSLIGGMILLILSIYYYTN